MTVRLIFKRNKCAQYAEYEYSMESECKTVKVDLPIDNEQSRQNGNIGQWQIVGYEEVKGIKEESK